MSEEKYKSITIKMLNVCLEGVHDVCGLIYMMCINLISGL